MATGPPHPLGGLSSLRQRVAVYASREDDTELAELAAAIGRHFFVDAEPTRLTLRCRRRPSQPLSGPTDGLLSVEEREPYQTVYTADVFQDSAGKVRVIKQVAAREAAPVRNSLPRNSGAAEK